MQFLGQTHQLRVPLRRESGGRPSREAMQAAFERVYRARFHVELPEIRANLVNLNCSVIGRRPEVDLSALIDGRERRATLARGRDGAAARPLRRGLARDARLLARPPAAPAPSSAGRRSSSSSMRRA